MVVVMGVGVESRYQKVSPCMVREFVVMVVVDR